MIDEHKHCRRTVIRRVERLSYILYTLIDMRTDDCPALQAINSSYLLHLKNEIDNLRIAIKEIQK